MPTTFIGSKQWSGQVHLSHAVGVEVVVYDGSILRHDAMKSCWEITDHDTLKKGFLKSFSNTKNL